LRKKSIKLKLHSTCIHKSIQEFLFQTKFHKPKFCRKMFFPPKIFLLFFFPLLILSEKCTRDYDCDDHDACTRDECITTLNECVHYVIGGDCYAKAAHGKPLPQHEIHEIGDDALEPWQIAFITLGSFLALCLLCAFVSMQCRECYYDEDCCCRRPVEKQMYEYRRRKVANY